jgi:hypothetical protein
MYIVGRLHNLLRMTGRPQSNMRVLSRLSRLTWRQSPRLPALACIVFAVFLAIVAAGLFVPLYGDEAAMKIMRGMFIADGWKFNTLVPQCNANYLRSVPALLYPGALAYDVAYAGATPLGIRLAGIVTDLCWIGLTCFALRTLMRPQHLYWVVLAALASIVGLGVMPLTFVMARGEGVLLVLLTLFVCFPPLMERYVDTMQRGRLFACAIAFCLLASLFFYTHPKTLFFFPVLLVSACLSFWSRSRLVCAAVASFVLVCMWQSLQFAFALTKCPNAPVFSVFLMSVTTPTDLLSSDPQKFLAALWTNVQAASPGIVEKMTFADTYESGWLAPSPNVSALPLVAWINAGIGYVVTAVIWMAAVLPPAVFLLRVVRRRLDGAAWCTAALWVGLLGHVAMYKAWSFYAGGLVIPLAALLVLLGLTAFDPLPSIRITSRAAALLMSPLYLLFLGSAGLLLFKVMPPTIHAAYPAGIGMPGQIISIPTLGYAPQRARIREFAHRCDLQGDGARHLVVDNLTFFAFKDLHEPLQSDYLYDQGFGVDYRGDALPALLRQIGAKGLIAQCTLLSASLVPKARRDGNLCCINFDETP